jgi:hypothetical protein
MSGQVPEMDDIQAVWPTSGHQAGLPRALLNLPRSGGEWINTYAASC